MKKYLLGLFILISLFFSLYKLNQVPACMNADEVAFSYNSYSLLKTGRDEYGAFMPLRLVSFRDYKLPLYSYLSMPIIQIFGLNDFSTRALNIIVAALFVPLMYLLIKQLFNNEKIALIGAFFTSISPWIYILTRHAHEGPLCVLFILLGLYFAIRFESTHKSNNFAFSLFSLLMSSFSYHFARLFVIFIGFYLAHTLIFKVKKMKLNFKMMHVFLLLVIVAIPFAVDVRYGANRVKNLLFTNNPGIVLRLNEYRGEHPSRPIHNKLTEGIHDVTNRYLSQISPEFLIVRGDKNWRFGFDGIGLITPIEYALFFIGLYFLFKNRARYRYLIVMLLAISPIPNALTWQDASLIRGYFLLFPLIFCTSYGLYYVVRNVREDLASKYVPISNLICMLLIGVFVFYLYGSWDIYLNHYPKRAVVTRAWQCGYKELADYVKQNYNRFDRFNITERHGQPYIYMLYYLQIDPASYQRQAKITGPDKYGFGQVDQFDKFNFKFNFDKNAKRSVFIGYPDEFKELQIDQRKIKKIKIGTEEIFWIYEN